MITTRRESSLFSTLVRASRKEKGDFCPSFTWNSGKKIDESLCDERIGTEAAWFVINISLNKFLN